MRFARFRAMMSELRFDLRIALLRRRECRALLRLVEAAGVCAYLADRARLLIQPRYIPPPSEQVTADWLERS